MPWFKLRTCCIFKHDQMKDSYFMFLHSLIFLCSVALSVLAHCSFHSVHTTLFQGATTLPSSNPNPKYFQLFGLFGMSGVQNTLPATESGCEISSIIPTCLLLNYSLSSAWPTFPPRLMEVSSVKEVIEFSARRMSVDHSSSFFLWLVWWCVHVVSE